MAATYDGGICSTASICVIGEAPNRIEGSESCGFVYMYEMLGKVVRRQRVNLFGLAEFLS